MDRSGRLAKVGALILLGFGAAFYLTFAVGETVGGDVSGIQHLPPMAILLALMYLAWQRPFAAGVILLVLALPLGAAYVVLVTRCEVTYTGRLSAFLTASARLLMIKADGSVLVHADAGGYKPLNCGYRPVAAR